MVDGLEQICCAFNLFRNIIKINLAPDGEQCWHPAEGVVGQAVRRLQEVGPHSPLSSGASGSGPRGAEVPPPTPTSSTAILIAIVLTGVTQLKIAIMQSSKSFLSPGCTERGAAEGPSTFVKMCLFNHKSDLTDSRCKDLMFFGFVFFLERFWESFWFTESSPTQIHWIYTVPCNTRSSLCTVITDVLRFLLMVQTNSAS